MELKNKNVDFILTEYCEWQCAQEAFFCFTLIEKFLSEGKYENLLGGGDIHIATHLLNETRK